MGNMCSLVPSESYGIWKNFGSHPLFSMLPKTFKKNWSRLLRPTAERFEQELSIKCCSARWLLSSPKNSACSLVFYRFYGKLPDGKEAANKDRFMNKEKMIEIEKKVRLESHHVEEITTNGTFIEELHIKDTYFDHSDFRFTTKNMWLRQRENQFELKKGIKREGSSIDRYEEISDKERILTELGFSHKCTHDMLTTLSDAGIIPFCTFLTKRRRYQLDEFSVDIDVADFGDLVYRVAEFELLVDSEKKIQEAEDKINHLLQRMQINLSAVVPAKLTYYLYNRSPYHYQALVDNKVIKPVIL